MYFIYDEIFLKYEILFNMRGNKCAQQTYISLHFLNSLCCILITEVTDTVTDDVSSLSLRLLIYSTTLRLLSLLLLASQARLERPHLTSVACLHSETFKWI
jgi:hypothetical protein